MTGTSTPRLSRSLRSISGTACAAASVFTVTRTSWEPAWARRATWIAVASGSAVSVFVIDCTTTGCADPTRMPPTSTLTVGRRRGRRLSGVAMPDLAAEAADDVEARHPDDEREQEHEADDIGELLGPEADPRSEDALERDHQHPTAVERRERQDVHDGKVGRQDPRDIQGHDRTAIPEDVADLGGDADGAGHRRGRRRVGSDRPHEAPEPADDQPHPADGLIHPDPDRGSEVVRRVLPEEVALERLRGAGDPQRALLGVDLGGGPERDGNVSLDPCRVGHGEDDRVARPFAQGDEGVRTGDELVSLAIDGDDRLARPESGGRR